MSWKISYYEEATKDIDELDGSQRKVVFKAIQKVAENPLSSQEGGYGKPLGKKGNRDLTGAYKIKLKSSGLRIVYELIRHEETMEIVVVAVREDELVYDIAYKRIHTN